MGEWLAVVKMKKISIIIIFSILLLSANLVSAHEHNFAETKQIIDSGISCDKLTDEQLEAIGDYYMEQMHPGEAHEMMDKMMGGEGSESLRQVHISMAKRLYCNEDIGGMMGSGSMMGMMNMMGGGMMSGYGMMGNWGFGFFSIIYLILLIGITILVYIWIIKLLKSMGGKK